MGALERHDFLIEVGEEKSPELLELRMFPSWAGRDDTCMQMSRLLERRGWVETPVSTVNAVQTQWWGLAGSIFILPSSVYNLELAGNAMSSLPCPLPASSLYREVKNEPKGELCPFVLGSLDLRSPLPSTKLPKDEKSCCLCTKAIRLAALMRN